MTTRIEIRTIDESYRNPKIHTIDDFERECREKTMDKTLADSFPASDPPSSLPNPSIDSFKPYDV